MGWNGVITLDKKCGSPTRRESEGKGKEKYLYSAIYTTYSLKALRHGSRSFTCKLHYACLLFVSVHQTAPPLTEVADIQLQLTTHLSILKRWKAELAWLVELRTGKVFWPKTDVLLPLCHATSELANQERIWCSGGFPSMVGVVIWNPLQCWLLFNVS